MKFKIYKKDLPYSYSLGVFPTIELLEKKPETVEYVALHSEGEKNSGVQKIKDLCSKYRIPCEIRDRDIRQFAYKENTYALTVFNKYQTLLENNQNHVVLDGLRNMGNLGTILRTMIAFGIYDVAIIRPAADIFDPKVISASMGSIFQIRFTYYEKLSDYIAEFSKEKVRKFYTFVVKNSKDIREVKFEKPFSLIFGNEGAGLSDDDAKLGIPVSIPQYGDVDSLNLSIAVGIGLYEAIAQQ